MKLVVFNEGRPGVWTERGIVDASKVVLPLGGHDGMRAGFDLEAGRPVWRVALRLVGDDGPWADQRHLSSQYI